MTVVAYAVAARQLVQVAIASVVKANVFPVGAGDHETIKDKFDGPA